MHKKYLDEPSRIEYINKIIEKYKTEANGFFKINLNRINLEICHYVNYRMIYNEAFMQLFYEENLKSNNKIVYYRAYTHILSYLIKYGDVNKLKKTLISNYNKNNDNTLVSKLYLSNVKNINHFLLDLKSIMLNFPKEVVYQLLFMSTEYKSDKYNHYTNMYNISDNDMKQYLNTILMKFSKDVSYTKDNSPLNRVLRMIDKEECYTLYDYQNNEKYVLKNIHISHINSYIKEYKQEETYNMNFVTHLLKSNVFYYNFNTLKNILNNKNIENNEKIVYEIIEENSLLFFTKQTKINNYLIYNAIFLENDKAKKVLQSLLENKNIYINIVNENVVKKTEELINKYHIKKEHNLLNEIFSKNSKILHKKL